MQVTDKRIKALKKEIGALKKEIAKKEDELKILETRKQTEDDRRDANVKQMISELRIQKTPLKK